MNSLDTRLSHIRKSLTRRFCLLWEVNFFRTRLLDQKTNFEAVIRQNVTTVAGYAWLSLTCSVMISVIRTSKQTKPIIHAEILKKSVMRWAFKIRQSAKCGLKIRNPSSFFSQIRRSANLLTHLFACLHRISFVCVRAHRVITTSFKTFVQTSFACLCLFTPQVYWKSARLVVIKCLDGSSRNVWLYLQTQN